MNDFEIANLAEYAVVSENEIRRVIADFSEKSDAELSAISQNRFASTVAVTIATRLLVRRYN